jgi:hypothetical protein
VDRLSPRKPTDAPNEQAIRTAVQSVNDLVNRPIEVTVNISSGEIPVSSTAPNCPTG